MTYSVEYFHARVLAEIESWPADMVADYARMVELLIENGPSLGLPHSRAFGDGLFELRPRGRSGIGRAFYCFLLFPNRPPRHGAARIRQENAGNPGPRTQARAQTQERNRTIYGLAALLNSHLIDAWFRSTNGNTQVSATEIRAMPPPPLDAIHAIGREAMHSKSLAELDEMVERLTGSREREIAGSSRRVKPHPALAAYDTHSLQLPHRARIRGREVEHSLHCSIAYAQRSRSHVIEGEPAMPKSHATATSGYRAHVRADKRAGAISGHIKNQAASAMTVVRDAITGRFVVGGTDERRLINQHGSISVKPAPGKPKYFTQTEIESLTKLMKVA